MASADKDYIRKICFTTSFIAIWTEDFNSVFTGFLRNTKFNTWFRTILPIVIQTDYVIEVK